LEAVIVNLLAVGVALCIALAATSTCCGWIACWLWANRTRHAPRRMAAAGGLCRPARVSDTDLQVAADDRMRATHRHDRTSVMHIHPADDRQIKPLMLPDPRTGDLLADTTVMQEVAS
jgi:hypothetical protein